MPTLSAALEYIRTQLLAVKATGADGFEGLLADSLAQLSGLTIRLAKSGSQFGRDASSPSSPFAIAIEGKRYEDSPTLEALAGKAAVGAHDLAGRIDVWVLGCTSEVGDGTLAMLDEMLEEKGITLLALDWSDRPLPRLAVVVAAARDATLKWFGAHQTTVNAGVLATHLDVIAADPRFALQAETLRAELNAAHVGLDALRHRSSEWLRHRFSDRAASQISFGQFVDVSKSTDPAVPRRDLEATLAKLVDESREHNNVVAVIGDDGVGKTWLIAQWWNVLPDSPIMIFVSGRRVDFLISNNPIEGLARILADQDGRSDEAAIGRWRRRLIRWQEYGGADHLRFVLVLDGLNEHGNQAWADIIKNYRDCLTRLGGIVIATSREPFWHREVRPRLFSDYPVRPLTVAGYSEAELTAVLTRAKIDPADLPTAVREFVRNPRVCALAIRVMDRLRLQPADLTVDRLLLAYWGSRLEERGDLLGHNVTDLNNLLRSHAKTWREQPRVGFDRDRWLEHSGAATRRGPERIWNDLTEIEEGRFLINSGDDANSYVFRAEALPFAIGLLINSELQTELLKKTATDEVADDILGRILDPVRGFDALESIVSAAVGLACLTDNFSPAGRTALIRAWCALQNVPEGSFDAMLAYVRARPDAFLDVAETSSDMARRLGRLETISELLLEARDHPNVALALTPRLGQWLGRWSKSSGRVFLGDEGHQGQREAEREERIRENRGLLVGSDSDVFSAVTHEAVAPSALSLKRIATLLLAGRPLAPHASAVFGWALAQSVARDLHNASESLAWIVRLNPVDQSETTAALLKLIDGVANSASPPMRNAAAVVLRTLGDAESTARAEVLDPREAGMTWRRVAMFCDTNPHDPDAAPGSNLSNARAALASIGPEQVWNHMSRTSEELNLETVTPALSRYDCAVLVDFIRRVVGTAPTRDGFPLRQLAWRLPQIAPLMGSAELEAIRQAFAALLEKPEIVAPEDYLWVVCELAGGLLPNLPAEEQLALILSLPRGMPLYTSLRRALLPLAAEALELATTRAMAQDEEALSRVLFFAGGSRSTLTSTTRRAVLDATDSVNDRVAIAAADVVFYSNDLETDEALLDLASNVAWKHDWLRSSFSHGRAVAGAVLRSDRTDTLHLIQPRFLSAVVPKFGDAALAQIIEFTAFALNRALQPVTAEAPESIRPQSAVSANGFHALNRIEEAVESGGELDSVALAELADSERGAHQFAERHRQAVQDMIGFEEALHEEGAEALLVAPHVKQLRTAIGLNPAVAREWLDRIMSTSNPRLLAQARSLGLAIAGAYSPHDAEYSATVFVRLRRVRAIWDINIDGVGIYEYALLGAANVPPLDALRKALLTDVFDDQALESATISAERLGCGGWLDEVTNKLLSSAHIGDQARAITIAGFRTANADSERILSSEWGSGFLGHVAAFARKNYQRAGWGRHWIDAALGAQDPIDYWRYAKLAEGVVDARFDIAAATERVHGPWVRFARDTFERLEKAAEERSKERAKTLFGHEAPAKDLVRMLRSRSC